MDPPNGERTGSSGSDWLSFLQTLLQRCVLQVLATFEFSLDVGENALDRGKLSANSITESLHWRADAGRLRNFPVATISGRCYLRSVGTGICTATFSQQTRPLLQLEIEQRPKSGSIVGRLDWRHNRQARCSPCVKSTSDVRRAPVAADSPLAPALVWCPADVP